MKLASSKVHFIGIGGIGMCGLAELLHNMGAKVSGSDLSHNAQVKHLQSLGVSIGIGHRTENINDPDVVVYSSAVKADNVEYQEARRRKIPLIARAEALAEMMRLKRGIAVGGSHGKTTTTSLLASVFLQAGLQPTIVVGGRLDLIKSTAVLGSGDWLIAEADESDGSFTRLNPEIAIITNIDNDHLDHYHSFTNIQRAFMAFASRIPFYGSAIVCGDDDITKTFFKDFSKRIIFYGFHQDNDFQLVKKGEAYQVIQGQNTIGEFALGVFGDHNALNALAAIIAGMEAGISFDQCRKGVEAFRGVDRRFQFKGQVRGAFIYDDYGHHPTEIMAVIKAARDKFPKRRVRVAFQPHRYSRTQLCWGQFLTCFKLADETSIFDIYPAGESPISGISSQRLVEEIASDNVNYVSDRASWQRQISQALNENDLLVTLGAGDIWKVADQLVGGE